MGIEDGRMRIAGEKLTSREVVRLTASLQANSIAFEAAGHLFKLLHRHFTRGTQQFSD